MTYFRDDNPSRYKSREHLQWEQGKDDEWVRSDAEDIPWKDDDDDFVFTIRRAYDPKERLGTATWYHWCGWNKDAKEILDEIAAGIPDEYDPSFYEETRFEHENNQR